MRVKFNNIIYEKGKRGRALKHLCFEIFKQYLNQEKNLEYKIIQKKFNLQHCTSQSVVLLANEWEQKPEDTKRRYFLPIAYNNLTLHFLEEWGNLGLNSQGKNCDNINHMIAFAQKENFDIQILDSEEKQLIQKEIKQEIIGNLENFKIKTLLLKGVPGTGKSRAIENIINDKLQLKKHKQNILRINIHSASSNADLMQGIGISSTDGKIEYKEKQGLILNFIEKATFNPNQPFVLVLEEIQENSLNELIGDLIYLIEDDKRAKGYEANDEAYGYQELVEKIIADNPETAYVEVPYLVNSSTEYRKMIMPDNLYIFCTSNYRDDKKVIEDNLLRRFEVLEIYPKYKKDIGESFKSQDVSDFLEALNAKILKVLEDEIHPDRFLIGHSNWLKVESEEEFYRAFLKVVVEFKDIKEVEFSDFKEIVKDLPIKGELNFSSYKNLIEDLQTKAGYDFLD